ncbi:DEAD/DEAH box helicase [Catenovulum sp. SM1970]|uniref:DEAD/DEAH box helicase n=1 Tax=Marinifaba aquimaris TaxID=2741323 RepID=UPI001571878F|nr:DEAD/DEAH box helicase [Marinifaba aquimaris]NTS78296.1 DEAD/DEAH box helicase [Marinifaba aquimaris]
MLFADLPLSEAILKAVAEQGYKTPSPIQAKAIPPILEGKDVMAAAQTGTGKTAGFTLPILERLAEGRKPKPNQARALILAPTRELAAQIDENITAYSKHLVLSNQVVFGGVKINPQMMKLRRGVDILVATPGRLLDLHQQNAVKFDSLEVLVLDEADRMLDMGFINDIKRILRLLPPKRQNLLFSATFSEEIRDLAKGLVNNPIEISVAPENTTAEKINQTIIPVDKRRKAKLLHHLIVENGWQQVLVFSKTKHGANRLTRELESKGVKAAAIHGNKSQGARTKALAGLKAGEISVLVATDIAARGIDIDLLPIVINFELPHVSEDYVHRIGRTGRAGSSGRAISLVCADEFKLLSDIEQLIQQLIVRETVAGFEPVNELPESVLRAPKKKKPKKPKKKQAVEGEQTEAHQAKPPVKKRSGQNTNKPKSSNNRPPRKSADNKSGNNSPSGQRRKRPSKAKVSFNAAK